MRLSATKALLERKDVIIIASVSAIYGLGDPDSYMKMLLHLTLELISYAIKSFVSKIKNLLQI